MTVAAGRGMRVSAAAWDGKALCAAAKITPDAGMHVSAAAWDGKTLCAAAKIAPD